METDTYKVRDHFLNPKNVGELKDANGVGEVGSLACGDALKLFLKIEGDRIIDAKFQTFGCASAIASSSVLTELITGKTVDEALALTNKDIADQLGGLPKEKMHCSVMGQEALEAAIRNWRGEPPLAHDHDSRIVCRCFGVTEDQIVKAIKENNLSTVEEVTNFTKTGRACGDCKEGIQSIIKAVLDGSHTGLGGLADFRKNAARETLKSAPDAAPLTNIQRMQKVMSVLENTVRPRLKQDGGDIELVDIDGKTVSVALRGMCTKCPSSRLTIEGVVQKALQEQVEPDLVVKEVS